jgi:predicted alpha/beta-hydrolase family hydrolase
MLRIYLAPGASGNAATLAPWIDGLRSRGFEAHGVALPRGRAEAAIARYLAQVPDEPGAVIGGHSFGGRVASLAVAGVGGADATAGAGAGDVGGVTRRHPFAGLVCLSYPLHRPGAPETAAGRSAHWPAIRVPALLLSGTSDPFAREDLLRAMVPTLPGGRLVTWPRLGHSLAPVREEALDVVAAFLREIERSPAG